MFYGLDDTYHKQFKTTKSTIKEYEEYTSSVLLDEIP